MTAEAPPLSKSERVYRELRSRIISGRYVAGYRIVLDQVARELEVSPVPVREAIRRLEAEKLVTFTRNVGAEVAAIDVGDYTETMQTLAYLEGAATSLAAPHLTAEELDEAEAHNEELRAMAESGGFDPRRFTEINNAFHRVLSLPCPNSHLTEMLDREKERITVIRRSMFVFEPARSMTSVKEHATIVKLIREGAHTDEIEKAARNHKLRSVREYLEAHPG